MQAGSLLAASSSEAVSYVESADVAVLHVGRAGGDPAQEEGDRRRDRQNRSGRTHQNPNADAGVTQLMYSSMITLSETLTSSTQRLSGVPLEISPLL